MRFFNNPNSQPSKDYAGSEFDVKPVKPLTLNADELEVGDLTNDGKIIEVTHKASGTMVKFANGKTRFYSNSAKIAGTKVDTDDSKTGHNKGGNSWVDFS